MSEFTVRDIVLQTIDQLRGRKARPDINRICHMLNRKHGFTNRNETERYIDKLVDAEVIIKVDYKGNTSYRNAKKWRKSHLGGFVLNSTSTEKMLVDAVAALTQGERDGDSKDKKGANIRDIEKWLISQPEIDRDALKSPLHVMLQREVDSGKLEKLSNGNYVVSPLGSKAGKTVLKRCSSTPSRRGRPPKKKKLRRFYSYMPEAKTPPPVVPAPEALCDFCRMSADSNRNSLPEELLICKDCDAKAHPSCMAYNHILAQRAQLYPWQCIDCKTCCVCEDSGEADSMLFCDGCDKGYHMDCHQPKVVEKPSGKWICYECIIEGILLSEIERLDESNNSSDVINEESSGSNVFPTPRHSPVPEIETKTKSKNGLFVPYGQNIRDVPARDYPDASKWSIEDVESFFESIGFKEQASAFKEQEIDGQSLLLMRRNDVLIGLSIRLGPALKIYEHVCKLQTAGHENSLFT